MGRFTNVESQIDGVKTDIVSVKGNLSGAMSTIESNLSNFILARNNEIKGLIGTDTDTTDSTLFGKLNGITDDTSKVNDLALALGTKDDTTGAETIFGKVKMLGAMISQVNGTINGIKTDVTDIKSDVTTILGNTDLDTFTEADLAALENAYIHYYTTENPTANMTDKMRFVVDYLRTNGYLK